MKSWLLILTCFVGLSGCIGLEPTKQMVKTYDLGIPLTNQEVLKNTNFYLTRVNAPEIIDSTDMLYRLLEDDPNRISSYTESRWRMSPAEYITNRFVEATGLPLRGRTQQTTLGNCAIDIRLSAFEQRFSTSLQGEAVVDWTVSVVDTTKRQPLDSRRVIQKVTMQSANAKSGVEALVMATNQAMSETVNWLDKQVLLSYPICQQSVTR